MSFLSNFIHNLSPIQQESSLSKFLTHNNTPVNQYCNLVPIVQPSLISTSFGQSLVALSILLIYTTLYRLSTKGSGVESRLLTSLIIGNLIFTALTFNDWFNLKYDVILCNDYKNGVLSLFQVSELIENYKFVNLVSTHWNYFSLYLSLVFNQFFNVLSHGYKNIGLFFTDSYKEVVQLIHEKR